MTQTYKYRAIKPDRTSIQGALEASSLNDAKSKLRMMGYIVLFVEDVSQNKARKNSTLSMNPSQLCAFTSQLAQLLEANIPLFESLEVLEDQTEGEKQQPLIQAIKDKIQKGLSFSKTIQEYPHTFPITYVAIISSGEAIGGLSQSMRRLSTLLTKEQTMKNRLISALIYPVLLTVLLFVSLAIMLFFVIPSIQGLFEGRQLPLFTKFIFGISQLVTENTGTLFILICLSFFLIIIELKRPLLRRSIAQHALTWPFIGNYIIKSSVARFSRTLSTLLAGGTPLNLALEKAKEIVSGNHIITQEIDEASRLLLQGKMLSQAFNRPVFPKLFRRMIALGEETGRLEELVAQVADVYEEETSRILDRATSLIQPLLLIGFGVIIGSTLLAILLPLSNFGALLDM